MKLEHIKACQQALLLVYQKLVWGWCRSQKVKFCRQIKIFGNNLNFDFLHEVRTLKAFQTGVEVALFYGQSGGQKGSVHSKH